MSSYEIDTVVLGVPCTIKFDYQLYEAAETGPEAMYPGCEEEIEITDIVVGEVSLISWVSDYEEMMELLEDKIRSYRSDKKQQYLEDRAEMRWNGRFEDDL